METYDDAAAAARVLPVRSSDSLEVRWIVAGAAPAAVRAWFARFPARTESREDRYLLWPCLLGLSVKLRGGRSVDMKAYLGSRGVMAVPGGGTGRLESWRKWSFPNGGPGPSGTQAADWVAVRKQRRIAWFPLPPAPGQAEAGRAGCAAELTEARASGRDWWSVGLEATGTRQVQAPRCGMPPGCCSPGRCPARPR